MVLAIDTAVVLPAFRMLRVSAKRTKSLAGDRWAELPGVDEKQASAVR